MVICRFEPVSYLLGTGLEELGYKHWAISNFQIEHPKPYGPDWNTYINLESKDRLRIIAMREDDRLIGYMSVILDTDIHNKEMIIADIRDIYVDESKRGHAAKLLRYAKTELAKIGVSLLKVTHRIAGTNPSDFYKAMKADLIEEVYGWRLKWE